MENKSGVVMAFVNLRLMLPMKLTVSPLSVTTLRMVDGVLGVTGDPAPGPVELESPSRLEPVIIQSQPGEVVGVLESVRNGSFVAWRNALCLIKTSGHSSVYYSIASSI